MEITAEERHNFEEAFKQAKPDVHILVAGKCGSGKSKLVNALTGGIVADEGDSLNPESVFVEKYEALSLDGYTINVWDSPGLFDGSRKEHDYVQSMKEKCGGKIDMLLYCIDMSATRADVDEMSSGMRLLTEALGQDIWDHTVIVLTYANVVAERITPEEESMEAFQTKVIEWKEKMLFALKQAGIQHQIAQRIPIEPAGDYFTPHLPDRIHWLGYLWLQFLFHIKEEAKLAILMTNQNRLRSSEYLQPTDYEIPLIIHEESCKNTRWWKMYSAMKSFVKSNDNGQWASKFCAYVIKKMLERKVRETRRSTSQ